VIAERKILEEHCDAVAVRIAHVREAPSRPIDHDATLVGAQRARHDLCKRRLSCPIVSDKTDDLARSHAEVDALQRPDGVEAHLDATQVDTRGHGGVEFGAHHARACLRRTWSRATAPIRSAPRTTVCQYGCT